MTTTLRLKKPRPARRKKPAPKPLKHKVPGHKVPGKARPAAADAPPRPRTRLAREPREAAHQVLSAVLRQGQPMDEAFDAGVGALEPRDRAFVRLLVATTLRRLGQIDDVLNRFLEREPPPAAFDALRLGAAQLLFVGTPVHAAVTTTVELIRALGQERLAGLANAVMRRLAREGTAQAIAAQDAAKLNTPAWLWGRWVAAHGEDTARAIAGAHMNEPATDVTLKDSASAVDLASRLPAHMLPTGSLRTAASGRVETWPGFDQGAWWVQDAAAALPAKILLHAMGDARGKRAVDLCAAPGGKTLQLAAAGCAVTAVDLSPKRNRLIAGNLTRMGLTAQVVTADVLAWSPPTPVDAVLLDAPCAATGTIRRHPDLPYLKAAADIAGLVAKQRLLLAHAATMLKAGGLLVYSVCSLEPEEGEGAIAAFLAAHPEFSRAPIAPDAIGGGSDFITPQGDVRTLPCHWPTLGGLDGFYVAALRRS
jgi:16S rRNA (cytosine967-C5)-methyltransferase